MTEAVGRTASQLVSLPPELEKIGSDMNDYDEEEFLREHCIFNRKLSKKLNNANATEFQIIHIDGPYPYAASWAGCVDIALFRRKVDCKKFIETFKGPGSTKSL